MANFTKIRPVWLLVLVASTTGLLVYALGDFGAPVVILILVVAGWMLLRAKCGRIEKRK